MFLPIFSYSESLLRQAQQRQILMSESSVLLLHCVKKHSYLRRSDVLIALANFENWKQNFISNSYALFRGYSGYEVDELFYMETMMECLFFAELYSWEMYADASKLNDSPFFEWKNGRLTKNRPLSELIFSKPPDTTA